ncbi:MAG: DUF2330 domain-containing protein [Deltaproteobacteria bacterium]|nr:DUF2330 domain-containing protein [Deltaproteobacteria bacterium]
MRPTTWLGTIAVGGLAVMLAVSLVTAPIGRARACGGCFAPNGSATVVTAHRMAMAMSPTQSTLWDQFAYAGDPEDFVWVLPSSPEARVELADNRFFEQLEQSTNVQLQGTFPPLQSFCSCGGRAPSAGAPPPPSPEEPPDVMVHHEGTVGPYETATVSSDDPMALLGWLQERGYGVPDAMLPTIRYYGEMGMAFVALRLSSGEGIQRMQPVRVIVPGLMYTLPLRMVSAGVADKVGLRLFVFADARYEAQNFPNATIDPDELYYDWASTSFNYDERFQAALDANGGRTWVTTYAARAPALGSRYSGEDGQFDIDDDLSVALEGLSTPTLTRMEASLGVAALDRDLILSLAADESEISNFVQVANERNRPPPPDCSSACGPGGRDPGTPPGTIPSSRGGSTCAAGAPARTDVAALVAVAVALGGLALVRTGVRRRRESRRRDATP